MRTCCGVVIGRGAILLVVLFAGLTFGGCMTVVEKKSVRERVIGYETEGPLRVGKPKYSGRCQLEGDDHAVCRLRYTQDCITRRIKRFRKIEHTTRESESWIIGPVGELVAGLGMTVLGGGFIAYSYGMDEPEDPYAPDAEKPEDMRLTGIVTAAFGVPLLIMAAIDGIRLIDSDEDLGEFAETESEDVSVCKEGPAAGEAIFVKTECTGKKVKVGKTDGKGELRFSLEPYAKCPLAFDASMAVFFDGRQVGTLSLDKIAAKQATKQREKEDAAMAKLVAADDPEACLAWLEESPGVRQHEETYRHYEGMARCAATELMRRAEKLFADGEHEDCAQRLAEAEALDSEVQGLAELKGKLAEVERKAAAAEARKHLADAQRAVARKDFAEARAELESCTEQVEDYAPCVQLAGRIDRLEEQERRREERREAARQRKLDAWGRRHFQRARQSAISAVAEQLRSPSTASWVSTKVLAQKREQYIVHVVVDAQNGFGAYIRNAYCVTLKLDKQEPKTYYINQISGIQECSRSPTEGEIELIKRMGSLEEE